jgi:hypothetical protein
MFLNKVGFHGEELLAPRPTLKLEDHPLSAVRYYLFNIFAALGGRSSICNPRTRHAVVTGTNLSRAREHFLRKFSTNNLICTLYFNVYCELYLYN